MIGSTQNRDALRALAARLFPDETVAGEGNLSRLVRAIAEGELVVVRSSSDFERAAAAVDEFNQGARETRDRGLAADRDVSA
jgi:hypothetical protein